MKASRLSGWGSMLSAFVVWFAHFMLCWAAVEIWPGQWQPNVLAWVFTPVALFALGAQAVRLRASVPEGEIAGWNHRVGLGAAAIASVAVVFSAVPAIVILP